MQKAKKKCIILQKIEAILRLIYAKRRNAKKAHTYLAMHYKIMVKCFLRDCKRA